ncbi:MAG TPA: dienelactone hydrolase family protein [Gammaproteobacteria bacterium]
MLDFIERGDGAAEPRLAVLWLHGLGADGYDFEPIVAELGLPGVRYVFPHAPVRPVTINGGLPMRAWFDIFDFRPDAPQDEAGIRESAAAVRGLVDREIARGVPSRRIVLAGFSQGGAIALHSGLREARPLGGIMALSAFLPLATSLGAEKQAANATTPILMAHGEADPVVPVEIALLGRRALEAEGFSVDWRTYPIAHAVCADEVRDIRRWLEAAAERA